MLFCQTCRDHACTTKTLGRPFAKTERLFDERGAAGVTVRAVAQEVGTTTRAVYSLFGSREALLVDSMRVRAYELLERWLHEQVETQDPAIDLVEASVTIFRRLVVEPRRSFALPSSESSPSSSPGLKSSRPARAP